MLQAAPEFCFSVYPATERTNLQWLVNTGSHSERMLQGKDDVNSIVRVPVCCLRVEKEEGGELPPPDLGTTEESDKISARRQITSSSLWRLFVFSEILTCKDWQINSNFRETSKYLSPYFYFWNPEEVHVLPAYCTRCCKGCGQREDQYSCRCRKIDMLMRPA